MFDDQFDEFARIFGTWVLLVAACFGAGALFTVVLAAVAYLVRLT